MKRACWIVGEPIEPQCCLTPLGIGTILQFVSNRRIPAWLISNANNSNNSNNKIINNFDIINIRFATRKYYEKCITDTPEIKVTCAVDRIKYKKCVRASHANGIEDHSGL